MAKIKVTLPDDSKMEFEKGITAGEVAYKIGRRLGKDAVAARINGELVDLDQQINEDVNLAIITMDSEEGLEIYRHTASHIMAHAVERLYDDVQLAIGPAIDDGFYYDIDMEESLSSEDLEKIEEEMEQIVSEDLPLERKELPRQEAINLMKEENEKYKVELIEDADDDKFSFYQEGEFIDLCRGPHLPSTGRLKAFKLLTVAGAYWRGDENNKMLQRIYGTAFPEKEQLKEYLHKQEEAKKRDHRKLGRELDLFSLHDEAKGFPFFHPRGMVLRNQLTDFWREEHRKAGYQEIKTPVILNQSLWKRSGHWDHYKEDMYFTNIDEEEHAIKPMNCPGGILIYKNDMHSYRDFPIRHAELGLVHRHELSGTLHGLMRVRNFTQDDAHIYCLPSQIEKELTGVIKLVNIIYSAFGFEYDVELSTKPDKAMGSDELWDRATEALQQAIEKNNLDYEINEGDGAFYGPKIDFHLRDCLDRTWQCGTIQLDFQMPERFDLTYIGEDNEEHQPVMIHRAIFGSLERFMGILIEHYAGAFPTWLSPVQAIILPVSDSQLPYAKKVQGILGKEKVRVEIDDSNEKLGYKIRQAQLQQIPYMLIVGDSEVQDQTVSVRDRRQGDQGQCALTDFADKITAEIKNKE